MNVAIKSKPIIDSGMVAVSQWPIVKLEVKEIARKMTCKILPSANIHVHVYSV